MKTSSKALEINDKNFDELIQSGKPVLVDFWAEWCGPCLQVSPVIEAVAEKYDGQAIVGKVNVDDNQQLSMKFGIRSIPTLMIFKNGEMVERMVGLITQKSLEAKLESQLG
ncbi:MAG: thioredoxin [Cytophagales bacterium]|nr:MAG: thioredoxin [Cytophagales bacterium]TAF59981.1 MAG: thioredoxin [Cytophagales bacterium]